MTSPDAAREPAAAAPDVPEPATPEDAARGVAAARGGEPLLPEQSSEDTDAAWGEYSTRDDERLYRDRPPHWDDV
ncbi:MAG TPA: hypothetical protein VHT26_03420 [Trebonia sp.]|jgi:hypothetical protein|nr:hypothetical protein [Trebonia sp.]